jgi:predicted secreted protein
MFGTAFFWGVSKEYTASFFMTEALFCNNSVAANFARQTGYSKCCVAVCLSSYKQRRGNISQQATAASCHYLSN